jgi:hypothetical protein
MKIGTITLVVMPDLNVFSSREIQVSEAGKAYLSELERKIAICREKDATRDAPNKLFSNCIGTAMYLSGLQGSDHSVEGDDVIKLKELPILSAPVKGCIIAWQNTMRCMGPHESVSISHMGIVAYVGGTEGEMLITHRDGPNKPFIENQKFSEVNEKYNKYGHLDVIYYLPPGLDANGVAVMPARNEAVVQQEYEAKKAQLRSDFKEIGLFVRK